MQKLAFGFEELKYLRFLAHPSSFGYTSQMKNSVLIIGIFNHVKN